MGAVGTTKGAETAMRTTSGGTGEIEIEIEIFRLGAMEARTVSFPNQDAREDRDVRIFGRNPYCSLTLDVPAYARSRYRRGRTAGLGAGLYTR